MAFSFAGFSENDGLMVSLVLGALTLLNSSLGGIYWMASGYR